MTQNPDTFAVKVMLDGRLSKSNGIFQFPATAPGVYKTMDIGRFVSRFEAFDRKGRLIPVQKVSVNQYKISFPDKVASVRYRVAETFDTPVDSLSIYLMCGSTIRERFAYINVPCVAGYFEGLQKTEISVSIVKPDAWRCATALKEVDGRYKAANYDEFVDSPFLIGFLTRASTMVDGAKIDVVSYSDNPAIVSDSLIVYMADMLHATRDFLGKLPVEKYVFLYCFLKNPAGQVGALEHSYSSSYVLPTEDTINQAYLKWVTSIATHEFFHIVTPLNLHSEVIESFNFVRPVPSLHLWLYEGVTEWAASIVLLRSGLLQLNVDRDSYLSNALQFKILLYEDKYDKTWSLKTLAERSFEGAGINEYQNIYFKGALVATYLDILLLDLSNGKSGLRELVVELMNRYGKGRPVSEDAFIDEIVSITYPEVREFFDDYVLGNKPLPHNDFLSKIGITHSFEQTPYGPAHFVKQVDQLTERQKLLFNAWRVNLPLRNVE